MSLSDYIRYMRAVKGGITPWEIGEAVGLPAGAIHLLEVKHRRMGEDDAMLEKLAGYFGVPVTELTARREAYRKRLASFLQEHEGDSRPIALRMEDGDILSGTVSWFSREAVALIPTEGSQEPYIAQRGWVADWRAEEDQTWQVTGSGD
jgi:hypothetical protein